jgi:glycine/D-amino acid oxidase-like deaminating enzyme
MTQEECFWLVDSPATKSYINKPLPQKADVVVIGGGYTGTSAALRLAKGGAKVVLLESNHIGWGASARNGGQALSCMHHNFVDLVKFHGMERAKAMFQASVHAADMVERVVAEEKIECGFERCGHIEAASKPAHFKKLMNEQEALERELGYKTQIVPREGMGSEIATTAYEGLMVYERSGKVQPAKFVQGLASAAERAGADIHEGTRVIAIERKGDSATNDGIRFTVHTERGTVEAKDVFVASNAWIGEIVPQFRHRVFPAESFIIATEPLREDLVRRLIPHGRVIFDTKNMLSYYRFSDDNRMVFGGRDALISASAKWNIASLRKGMLEVFPELQDAAIDYYWHGTLGMTMDEATHAGQVGGLWYSMCYVGHGVTLATYMGEQIANAILGMEYENPFDEMDIPLAPFYHGKAWFVDIGKMWYRLLDAMQ